MRNSSQVIRPDNKTKLSLVLLFFTFIIYSNSLGGDFVYDDKYFIVKNIHIRNLENIPSFFVNPSTAAFAELARDVYRPITTLSFAIDYRLWALNTFGYHLENVILHGINAMLVFILIDSLFGSMCIAFLSSILFACHPVQTEAVAWISGRSSVLFLLFYLASFIMYLWFIKSRLPAYLFFSLGLFAISLFSKEMAISLPLALLSYEIYFVNRARFKQKLLRLSPYFLAAVLFVSARYLALKSISQCGWWGGNAYHTFLTMLSVVAGYMKLLIFPAKLCAFYVTPLHTSIMENVVLFPAVALIILIAASPFIFKRSREILFGISLFFITLLPVSNIVPLKALMAERFLYLPSIGFCFLTAVLLTNLAKNKLTIFRPNAKRLAIGMAIALVMFYSARTMMRNEDWKDSLAITSSILKVDPLNPWGLMMLGAAYSDRGEYEKAIKPLIRSIELSKDYFAPRNVLGFCLLSLGRDEEAVSILGDALKIKPYNLEALNSLGVAYAKTKRYDKAIEQFEQAVKIDPLFMDGYVNLGSVYDEIGQPEMAIQIYEKAASSTRFAGSKAIMFKRIREALLRRRPPYDKVMADERITDSL